jgi:hypothetical protein
MNMTAAEFIKKYGNVTVKFSSYYKYTFTYTGKLPDGSEITVDCGGNGDQIYRQDVIQGKEYTVSELLPYAGRVDRPDGSEVDSFYDY